MYVFFMLLLTFFTDIRSLQKTVALTIERTYRSVTRVRRDSLEALSLSILGTS